MTISRCARCHLPVRLPASGSWWHNAGWAEVVAASAEHGVEPVHAAVPVEDVP